MSVESWSVKAMGGQKRINEIKDHLNCLRTANIELIVMSKGYRAVVNWILKSCDLLRYFSTVIGNIDSNYGTDNWKMTDESIREYQSSGLFDGVELKWGLSIIFLIVS